MFEIQMTYLGQIYLDLNFISRIALITDQVKSGVKFDPMLAFHL